MFGAGGGDGLKLFILRGVYERHIRSQDTIDEFAFLFLCGSRRDAGKKRYGCNDHPHVAQRAEGRAAL